MHAFKEERQRLSQSYKLHIKYPGEKNSTSGSETQSAMSTCHLLTTFAVTHKWAPAHPLVQTSSTACFLFVAIVLEFNCA